MSRDNLVHMANRIAEFFAAMPDHAQAVDGVAEHLRKFWEPRMRRQILAHVATGGEGLHALALEALNLHRDSLTPREPSEQGSPALSAPSHG